MRSLRGSTQGSMMKVLCSSIFPHRLQVFPLFPVAQVFLGSSYLLVTEKTEKPAAQSHFQ